MNTHPRSGSALTDRGPFPWAAGSIVAGLYLALLAAIGTPAGATTAQAVSPPPSVTIGASYGEALFFAKGCAGCHSLRDAGIRSPVSGPPDLSSLRLEAGDRRPGMTAAAYVSESLRQPQAYIADEHLSLQFDMPVLGLSDAEIAALTAFLLSNH